MTERTYSAIYSFCREVRLFLVFFEPVTIIFTLPTIVINSSIPVSYTHLESFKVSEQAENKVNITEGLSEVTGDLSNTEYDTVEKIESKLTETILSNEGYSADNTVLYDIEFVTSEDGGETWIPVTAENFPAEGIEVTLPYPEGTNGTEYDFTVVHMFDEDVNGHKAGEVETPEVTRCV